MIKANQQKQKLNVIELFERRKVVRRQIEELETEDLALTEMMKQLIPNNATKNGVAHGYSISERVKYADYATYLLDKFVPINRKATASADRNKFLTKVETHTIKEVKKEK